MMTPSHALIEFDLSSAEWIVVAYLTGDANMLDVVESGVSPHTRTGALISRVTEEVVEKEHKAVGLLRDPDEIQRLRSSLPELGDPNIFLPRTMSIRQCGKKSNHALNYNMGYKRFALENEVEEVEAKKVVELYRTVAYPGVPVWHETIRNKLRKDRTLTNCFGRKRVFRDAWGADLFDAAYAFIPQSTVYDITRRGLKLLWEDHEIMRDLDILAQVHDSVLVQCPIGDSEKVSEACLRIANNYLSPLLRYNGRDFRIRTDIKIGLDWGSMEEVPRAESEAELARNIALAVGRLRDDGSAAERLAASAP